MRGAADLGCRFLDSTDTTRTGLRVPHTSHLLACVGTLTFSTRARPRARDLRLFGKNWQKLNSERSEGTLARVPSPRCSSLLSLRANGRPVFRDPAVGSRGQESRDLASDPGLKIIGLKHMELAPSGQSCSTCQVPFPFKSLQLPHSTIEINFAKVSSRSP
jgi:hypothetical protein